MIKRKKSTKKIRKRRPGAGRKKLGKEKFTFKLFPDTHQIIGQRAKEAGISRSEFVEAAVREKIEADKTLKRSSEDNQRGKNRENSKEFWIRTVNEQGGRESSAPAIVRTISPGKTGKPQIDPLELLNHLLKQSDLSGKDLAQILGLDVANAAQILEGTSSISPAHAQRLGERFKVRPALFLPLEYRNRKER